MKKITLLLSFIACVLVSQAQTLLTEDFNYTIGSDLKSQGWPIHSGSGATKDSILVVSGLTFDGYVGSNIGGAAALTGAYCDQNKTFTAQTAGTVYASFLMKTGSVNRPGYFFHFAASPVSTIFFTRVWTNATGTGTALGTFASGTEPTSYVPISANTTYLFVVKYDFTSKISSLYFFTTMPTTEPTTAQATFTETGPANVGAVCLRQYTFTGSTTNENIIVDGIRVATSWAALFAGTGVNPVSADKLEVTLIGKKLNVTNVAENSVVDVYSTLGAKVQTGNLVAGSIQLNDLAKGLYVVRVANASTKIKL